MRTPYEELGINKNATPEEIKTKFREKAKEFHPDAGGDSNKFDRLRKAKDLLQDPVRRLHYDETGEVLEDSSENSIYTRARNDFIKLVLEIIKSPACADQGGNIDFIGSAKMALDKGRKDCQNQIEKITGGGKYCNKIKSKFTYKDNKTDIIKELFESMEREESARLRGLKDDLRNLEMVEEMFKNYSYAFFDDSVWQYDVCISARD